ncbi:MAG: hypothetical protein ACRD0P_32725, partial [Stackebrandtia sp.]
MTAVPTTGAGTSHSPTPGPPIPEPAKHQRHIMDHSGRLLRNTPGQLTLALVAVMAFISVFGLAAIVDTSSRSTSIDEASGRQGRMAIAAFQMYRSLSDADAAITTTFLPRQSDEEAKGDEDAIRDAFTDYEDGVKDASTAMTT